MNKVILIAKCSDKCSIALAPDGAITAGGDGYVPSQLCGDMGSDYISLVIDNDTGQILNWQPLTASDLADMN